MAIDLNHIKAVVFDVYGTIAQIRDRRAPFKQLLHYANALGHSRADGAMMVMTYPGTIRDHAMRMGLSLPNAVHNHLDIELTVELASVALYDDVNATLAALHQRGYAIGLCSNLAEPYARPIREQLTVDLQCVAWSFEIGVTKPDPVIYASVAKQLACRPEEIVFVGDSTKADYDGPINAGMRARLIDRKKSQYIAKVLAELLI